MKSILSFLLLTVFLSLQSANAFVSSGLSGGSSFVVSRNGSVPAATSTTRRGKATELYMGSQAKFGIFSPAVYAAKAVLGQDKLNKIRGKAISYHSQYIGDFCEWVGAYHMRTRLIKKAKVNGDTLGFLV
jgi:hypothetical protein